MPPLNPTSKIKVGQPMMQEIPELAFRAFIRAFGLFRNAMDPYFARFGISAAQWGVLRQLHRAETEGLRKLRPTDLCRRLLVKPPSITTLLDRLERFGYLARTDAAGDQRAKEVALTRAGRQLVARVLRHHPNQIRRVLAGLTMEEQHELHRLMEKFGSHLVHMIDCTSPGGPG